MKLIEKNYNGKIALVYTCQNNKDLEPIKLLLENGTISNIISNNGKSHLINFICFKWRNIEYLLNQ